MSVNVSVCLSVCIETADPIWLSFIMNSPIGHDKGNTTLFEGVIASL